MDQRLVPKSIVFFLVAGGVALPIAVCVCLAVGVLLQAMGDAVGGVVLTYVAWGCGGLWGVDLICLLLAAGINSLGDTDPPPKSKGAGKKGTGRFFARKRQEYGRISREKAPRPLFQRARLSTRSFPWQSARRRASFKTGYTLGSLVRRSLTSLAFSDADSVPLQTLPPVTGHFQPESRWSDSVPQVRHFAGGADQGGGRGGVGDGQDRKSADRRGGRLGFYRLRRRAGSVGNTAGATFRRGNRHEGRAFCHADRRNGNCRG